jgi:hypothetical protein
MNRGAPMKRSGFATVKPIKRFNRRRPATSAIRQSARGESCTLGFPCCNGDIATVVWCHSNRLEDGKGMGLKARDEEGCYGCSSCHAFLDGGYVSADWERAVVEMYFDHARSVSQQRLYAKGLL